MTIPKQKNLTALVLTILLFVAIFVSANQYQSRQGTVQYDIPTEALIPVPTHPSEVPGGHYENAVDLSGEMFEYRDEELGFSIELPVEFKPLRTDLFYANPGKADYDSLYFADEGAEYRLWLTFHDSSASKYNAIKVLYDRLTQLANKQQILVPPGFLQNNDSQQNLIEKLDDASNHPLESDTLTKTSTLQTGILYHIEINGYWGTDARNAYKIIIPVENDLSEFLEIGILVTASPKDDDDRNAALFEKKEFFAAIGNSFKQI